MVPVVGALLLGLGTAACSPQERNYEIPSTMCGTAVSPDLLEPLLPPGDKISTTLSDRAEGMKRCLVNVDGEQVLAFNIEWREKGSSLFNFASVFPGVDPSDKESEDGRYLYSDTGAVGKVTCPKPRKTSGDLFVATRVANSGKPDEAAMRKLIAAYAEAVGTSDECT
ncbi:MAG TPA: hypothetical protein VE546_24495 [Streptomyces sp.]|uniref:hypothetical protein n=1 Tax=Streptomyces sp. TaxID=1931 RepID=UPI002D564C81|nr:hypothetical protein [Streptomyces sp.]HZG06685.1 hypothetical protein [Streptomyces sp.]